MCARASLPRAARPPQGVYANLTIELYDILDSKFFRIWGAIYAACTLALWTAVFARTLTLVYHGAIFESPCLEDFDMARAADMDEKKRLQGHKHVPSGVCTPCSGGSGR